MGTARKLILTAFFIYSCERDTGARTKIFHRKNKKKKFHKNFKKLKKKFHKNFKKKIFQKNFSFALKNTLKSPQHKNLKKKIFFSKIGLEFFAYHDQLVDRTVSRVAPIERKSNFAYLQCNQKKIFKMDHCQILSERPKVYIFVHFGTNGLRIIRIGL